ncbi:MFS transporter [Pseudarthrobacter sp. H2]|uniref:MFS transporter n=1 Tax=Pseudarthrobacter sp. H2 TaxID=3418415 RepID=UPI003CE75167
MLSRLKLPARNTPGIRRGPGIHSSSASKRHRLRVSISRTRPLVAVCLATSLLGVDPQLHVLAMPVVSEAFRAGPTENAVLRSLATVVLAVTMLGAGRWSQRWGLRRAAVLAAAALTGSSLLSALAWDVPSLATGRLVTGAATAVLFAAGLAVLAGNYRGRALTIACSMWLAWDAAAILLAGPLGGDLVDAAGWRSAYMLTALAAALACGACRVLLHPVPGQRKFPGTRILPLLRHRGFLAAGLAGLGFNFSNGFFLGAYPILGAAAGIPTATVGLVTALIGGGSVFGALIAGFARGCLRLNGRAMYLSGLGLLVTAGVAQTLISPATLVTVPLLGCLVVGAAVMWVQQPQSELMFEIAGPSRTAAVAPVKTSLGQLGMAAGLAAASPVLSLFDSAGALGSYAAGSVVAAVVPFAAAVTVVILLWQNPRGD